MSNPHLNQSSAVKTSSNSSHYCSTSPVNPRFIASLFVLLTATAFAGFRLWDILSFTSDYYRNTISDIYENGWFLNCAGDTLSAFYLALAIRGLLHSRRLWRTVFTNMAIWLFLLLIYLLSIRYCGTLWSTLFVILVHFSALVYVLIADIFRSRCIDKVKSKLQPRNA